jgi:hypothetical protein
MLFETIELAVLPMFWPRALWHRSPVQGQVVKSATEGNQLPRQWNNKKSKSNLRVAGPRRESQISTAPIDALLGPLLTKKTNPPAILASKRLAATKQQACQTETRESGQNVRPETA